MKCKMMNEGIECGEPIYIYLEGNAKYDVYRCKSHGLISVLKGRTE